jgi:hypothetical protein
VLKNDQAPVAHPDVNYCKEKINLGFNDSDLDKKDRLKPSNH